MSYAAGQSAGPKQWFVSFAQLAHESKSRNAKMWAAMDDHALEYDRKKCWKLTDKVDAILFCDFFGEALNH